MSNYGTFTWNTLFLSEKNFLRKLLSVFPFSGKKVLFNSLLLLFHPALSCSIAISTVLFLKKNRWKEFVFFLPVEEMVCSKPAGSLINIWD